MRRSETGKREIMSLAAAFDCPRHGEHSGPSQRVTGIKKVKMELQNKMLHSNRCEGGKILQLGSKLWKFIFLSENIYIHPIHYIGSR